MSLTLRQLRYFEALAREGSFGRAAVAVNISQPALSMQIRELEDRLGAPLIERLPREVRLTRIGREVLRRASRVLAEMAELEAVPRRAHGLMGELKLGVIPTVAPYLLPVALTRLRARDLTLEIRVREAQTAQLLAGLEAGALDAAVLALPIETTALEAITLCEDRFVLAGSAARLDHLGPAAEELRPTELGADQLLLLDEGHCLADQAIAACSLDPTRRRVDLGASSLATLCGLVAEGFGLTLLPEIAVRSELAGAPALRLRRFSAPEPRRTLVLLRRATGGAQEDWFAELATVLEAALGDLLAQAHRIAPVAG
ncbi:MAG: LysR substrate-binding domain-containing protein [Celeribacter sp.]|jgi:LysR family hydrogen peroxide-inducible transcriptional activator